MSDSEYQDMLRLYNNNDEFFWDYPDDMIDEFFDRLFDDARGAK